MDYTTGTTLPHEIKSFRISKGAFKEILNNDLGAEIKSITIKDDKVEFEISKTFLNVAIGDKYDRDIDEISVDGDEVDICLSNGHEEDLEGEKEEGSAKTSILSL